MFDHPTVTRQLTLEFDLDVRLGYVTIDGKEGIGLRGPYRERETDLQITPLWH